MQIEFDPDEDAKNLCQHKIPLSLGAVVLANMVGEVEDTRRDYGEPRTKAYGKVEGVWFCCIYTMRGKVHRLISVHRVRAQEMRRWLKNI